MLELIFFSISQALIYFLMEVNFLEEKKGKMTVEEAGRKSCERKGAGNVATGIKGSLTI